MQGVQVKLGELTLEQKRELTTFYHFGKNILRVPIYDGRRVAPDRDVCDRTGNPLYTVRGNPDWQKRLLDAVDVHNSRVSARSANGAGKTNVIIPTLALAHMTFFPDSRTVITSGVERQVREQIWPALTAHKAKFRGWSFNDTRISAPNGAVCLGFSTDDGGKFEGWHGNKEELYALSPEEKARLEEQFQRKLSELTEFISGAKGPLLMIVDEAKSVRQEIYDAIERCTYQRLVLLSSCGPAEGAFYRSHHEGAAGFTEIFRIPASECPHADHEKNAALIADRGANDPLVRSKVFADFMRSPGDTVIDRAAVDETMARPPRERAGARKIMCDFAAGGDENVIAFRNGNKVTIAAAWRDKDTMRACSRFIVEFRKLRANPDEIYGDNDGLGKVCIDKLHEMGWPIQRINNNSKAENSEAYVNRSAEAWWEGGKAIAAGQLVLPNDPLLAAQLSSRKPHYAKGKLGVESKEDMRSRGVSSPDRADAVLEAIKPERSVAPVKFSAGDYDERDLSQWDLIQQESAELSGVGRVVGASCE